ncbi:hypothetical protein AX15_002951 [Amanita polypyramis BW_CC]|nr:hypothetical protein AX15_002951 [Amanita polypyramis BW_CC]
MSPRPALTRRSTQPKSSRQQFSACGACRMRRVRCDLKDLSLSSETHQCSNCKERGLNCVDEYAEMKTVKLLRRGRRLQQVEAMYGKIKNVDSPTPAQTPSQIPALNPNFFSSPFWTLFCIQRPILDPSEFRQRYIAHTEGTHLLGHEGRILAMLLVLWAATFGIDESGSPIEDEYSDSELLQASDPVSASSTGHGSQRATLGSPTTPKPIEDTLKYARKRCQKKTDSMLREILELVDLHGIMRRPTFDSVRILFLILPLLEEAPHLERTAMHEVALSQARALCAPVTESPALLSSPPPFSAEENYVRARVYLYAQTQEGISAALKGGHLVFHSDDLDTLQRTTNALVEHLDTSTVSTSFIHHSDHQINGQMDIRLMQLTAMPFRLSSVCRKVHDVLTGAKAARLVEEHNLIDANGMREIWDELDQCWRGFVALKINSTNGTASAEYFVDAWLIFVFECHNVILESLKIFTTSDTSRHMLFPQSASRPSSSSSTSSPYLPPHPLCQEAETRCIRLLPHVSRIIRHHLSKDSANHLNLFTWDTGLVRDGCFFAALLSVSLHGDLHCLDGHDVKLEESDDCISPEEGANLCLAALAKMRWVFSKSDERIETIHLALKNSKETQKSRSESPGTSCQSALRHMEHSYGIVPPEKSLHPYPRTVPHLNIVLPTSRRVESAPNTACSTDGTRVNGWPTYTPPLTASSLSNKGSPFIHEITSPGSYKSGHDDPIFYHVPETLDRYANTSSIPQTNIPIVTQALYQPRNTFFNDNMNTTAEPPTECLSPSLLTPTDASLQSTEVDSYIDSFYS